MRTAAALTVLAVPSAMLSGSVATAFAVPGDFSTTPSPTTGSATTEPAATTTSDEAKQTGLTPVELTLSPGHGEPGSTVKGTAMLMVQCAPPQTGTLSLSWDGRSLTPTNITATDPASGSIAFDFTVPATAKAGPHTVAAVCPPPNDLRSRTYIAHGYTGSAAFTVDPVEKPTFTVSPGQGPPGAQVTASGTGFTCDTDLALRWDDGLVLADRLPGTFTARVSVPADASADGSHSITASCRDDPDNAISQPFTVTPAALSTTVTTGVSQVVTGVTGVTVSPSPTPSEPVTPDTTRSGPPWWLITLIVAAVLTGATYFFRRSRARPAHVGADVRAVPHFDTAPTVTVRETPAPGEVARSIGLVPHPDPGTQTFLEVFS